MGDAGTASVAAAGNLTAAGVQTVTGAKTFNDQKLVFRNPADTFSLTMRNPAITANKDTWLNNSYSYYIFKDGTTYYAKNGATTAIDASGSDASTVINTAIALCPTSGASIMFNASDTFTIASQINCIDYLHLFSGYQRRTNAGGGARFIRDAAMTTGAIFGHANPTTDALTGATFQGLYIDGVDRSVAVNGIDASLDWGFIERCEIYNCNIGVNLITVSGTGANWINRNRIYNCDRGILSTNVVANLYTNNVIAKCNKDLVKATGYSQMILGNKVYEGAQTAGFFAIVISAANHSIISNNMIEPDNSNMHCIQVASSDDVLVYGNRAKTGISLSGRTFIQLSNANRCLIALNQAAYSAQAGFFGLQETGTCAGNVFVYNDLSGGTFPGGNYSLTTGTAIDKNWQDHVTQATAPGSPASANIRSYSKIVDSNNDGLFVKRKINGAVVEVQL